MALFSGKGDKNPPESAPAKPTIRQLQPRAVYCYTCEKQRPFSRVWERLDPVAKCTGCGTHFEDPAALYRKNLPTCPRCGEFLEHPGFEYGLCDKCGSKYEITPGTKPSLLPNKKQRDEMNKVGKSWSRD